MESISRLARFFLPLALAGLLTLAPSAAGAPAVNLDRSLGGDGAVATSLNLDVTDAALDHRRRVVLGGIRNGQPAVARLLKDGTPDPAFGGDGIVHEGSVDGALNVDIELSGAGSIRALALTESGPDRYLRIDFDSAGAQTYARYFEGAAGSADLTPAGGALATFVEDGELITRLFRPDGSRDPGFTPAGQPAANCSPRGSCAFFSPFGLSVNPSGTVVRAVKAYPSAGACDGGVAITALNPNMSQFTDTVSYQGCGITQLYSIATDPRGRFLVSGWAPPPPRALFIRLRRNGSLDRSFGDQGTARSPTLDTDNLFISDPAFTRSGAFFNSLTQPREPTLRLRPSRFDTTGRLDRKFSSKTPEAVFDGEDGLEEFDPVATLRSDSRRITVVGTGQSASGPVPALARWRPSKKR